MVFLVIKGYAIFMQLLFLLVFGFNSTVYEKK